MIVHLCSLTYKKERAAGEVIGTGIAIINVDTNKGVIVFRNYNEMVNNRSKSLNVIKFKVLTDNTNSIITIK